MIQTYIINEQLSIIFLFQEERDIFSCNVSYSTNDWNFLAPNPLDKSSLSYCREVVTFCTGKIYLGVSCFYGLVNRHTVSFILEQKPKVLEHGGTLTDLAKKVQKKSKLLPLNKLPVDAAHIKRVIGIDTGEKYAVGCCMKLV